MLTALQRQLIYFPDSTRVPPAGDVIEGARDVTLHTSDGLALGAWFVPASTDSDLRMAVLVAPGNGGNPGSPSEDGLAKDAVAATLALDALGYPAERTIYFGESLGTGVVTALQVRRTPAGVVLRSPFTELAEVGAHHYPWLPVRLLLKERFQVTGLLSDSEVPVTVIYGDRDSVVPSELSARVADEAPTLAERVVIRGADHNDEVMFGPRVADAVERLARMVAPGDGPRTR